ncbi:MAG: hypothetical protein HFE31_05520 [Clostridia bacterium]|nr:hypothetical protein [Clostridia bacterium]
MAENQNVAENQKTVCHIGAFGLWLRLFLVGLVSACTAFIAFPWMVVWVVGYVCNNTTVDGNKIEYTCTGGKRHLFFLGTCKNVEVPHQVYSHQG